MDVHIWIRINRLHQLMSHLLRGLAAIRSPTGLPDGPMDAQNIHHHQHTRAHLHVVLAQAHHSAREVYLCETADDNEAASLLRCATVCAPGDLGEHEGVDDLFVCDHAYHRGCQVCSRA